MLTQFDVETEMMACDDALDFGLMTEAEWEQHIARFLQTFGIPDKKKESEE